MNDVQLIQATLIIRASQPFKYGNRLLQRGDEFYPEGNMHDAKLIANMCDIFLVMPDGKEIKVK